MKTKFLTLIMIVLSKLGFGQYEIYETYLTPFLSDSIQSGFFYFNVPNSISAGFLYQQYRINAPDLNNDMLLIDTHTDSLAGLTHFKYQQLFMDIPIEGAGCIEHYQTDGSLLFINAKIADSIKQTAIPTLSRQIALELLIRELELRNDSIIFAWQDQDWEKQIQIDYDDSTATWYPQPELIWAIDTFKNMQVVIPGNRYSLAYKIHIFTVSPFESIIYYVDAHTGSILKSHSTHVHDGPADVYGYGSKTIDTQWKGGFTNAWILHANNGTRDIHTKKNPSGSTAWWLLSNTTDDDDDWGSTYLSETSTHYHVISSWDYYLNTFGRTGVDDEGSEIRVRTGWNDYNAKYDFTKTPRELVFGTTTTGWDFGMEPSIVGHEFSHGVIDYTSSLGIDGESGSLNESFADIFGVVIQAVMLDGGTTDWIMGNQVPDLVVRSLINPKDYNQPDTYLGVYWDHSLSDIHRNGGVQNKWFYLLASGGSGYNDLSNYYEVSGIDINKAAQITYYAFTSILMGSSQYSDSRQATIQAAIILFGECSLEHQATVNAWHAVGIGNPHNCTYTLAVENEVITEQDILIYPNPANNLLNIKLPYAENSFVQIYDATGKLAAEFSGNETVLTKDVSFLDSGVYFVNITINDKSFRKKIVIQK